MEAACVLLLLILSTILVGIWARHQPNKSNNTSQFLFNVTDNGSNDTELYSLNAATEYFNSTSCQSISHLHQTITVVPLCCFDDGCTKKKYNNNKDFFPIYDVNNNRIDNATVVNMFCQFRCDSTEQELILARNDGRRGKLFTNGTLRWSKPNKIHYRDYTNFCLSITENYWELFVCLKIEKKDSSTNSDEVNPFAAVSMLISVPFLVATFFVYVLIENLRNTHGRTLCAYILCLIVGYSCMGSAQLLDPNSLSDLSCLLFGYTAYVSFLASFFWLNVMCFDIWRALRGIQSRYSSIRKHQWKKFIIYSIYAWGCASILAITTIVMDRVPGIPDELRPKLRNGNCWFTTEVTTFLYFYGPMSLIVLCNTLLFILTAFKLFIHQKNIRRQLKDSESKRHDNNKKWFILYLKLFIVMGITWGAEIVSSLMRDDLKGLWFITDLANTLQGVTIFFTFVWKDKVKHRFLQRFGLERSDSNSRYKSYTTTSSTLNHSSAAVPLQEKFSSASCKNSEGFNITDRV